MLFIDRYDIHAQILREINKDIDIDMEVDKDMN